MKLFAHPDPTQYSSNELIGEDDAGDDETEDASDDAAVHDGQSLLGPASFAAGVDTSICLSSDEAAEAALLEREVDAIEVWLRSLIFHPWAQAKERLLLSSTPSHTAGTLTLHCTPDTLRSVLNALTLDEGKIDHSRDIETTVLALQTSGEIDVVSFITFIDATDAQRSQLSLGDDLLWLQVFIRGKLTTISKALREAHEEGCYGRDEDYGAIISECVVWETLETHGIDVPDAMRQPLSMRYSALRGRASYRLFRVDTFLQALRCTVTLSDVWLYRDLLGSITHAPFRCIFDEVHLAPYPHTVKGDVLLNADPRRAETALRVEAILAKCQNDSAHVSVQRLNEVLKEVCGVVLPEHFLETLALVYNESTEGGCIAYEGLVEDLEGCEVPVAAFAGVDDEEVEENACAELLRFLYRKWCNRGCPSLHTVSTAAYLTPGELRELLRERVGACVDRPLLDCLALQLAVPSALGLRRSYAFDTPQQQGYNLRRYVRQPRPLMLPVKVL